MIATPDISLLSGIVYLRLSLPRVHSAGGNSGKAPDLGFLLAGYCLARVIPALVLLAGRVVAASRKQPLLGRLNDWVSRHADTATGYVLGVAGFSTDAAAHLWWT